MSEDLVAAVEAWRRQRYAALRRDMGWLTLAGLGWLREGTNRVGSDDGADVVLPAGPAIAGTVRVEGRSAVADGAFTYDGEPARELHLRSDLDGDPTILELGALRIGLIERGGRLALRTWNLDAPARREFTGLDHWPVDPAWRVLGTLDRSARRSALVPDVLGTAQEEQTEGVVGFELHGTPCRLDALPGDAGALFLVFGDLTNGTQTYAAGRFLYTEAPDPDGTVAIDFNRAYNPPCALSPYATCPLPWPENRLAVRVEAGERAPVPHRA